MKYSTIKLIAIALFISITFNSLAQNATIDYQAWNPSSPPCNLFANATNVPATIGGSSTNIEHQTKIGQPKYNTSSQAVELECTYTSTSQEPDIGFHIVLNKHTDIK